MRISDWSSDVCSSDLDSTHAPAAAGVMGGRQGAAGPHGFLGGHPVHFVEGSVVDIVGIDTRTQSAHEPGAGWLSENRRSDGVDANQFQIWTEPAKHSGDTSGMSAGTYRANQGVNVAELGREFMSEIGRAHV